MSRVSVRDIARVQRGAKQVLVRASTAKKKVAKKKKTPSLPLNQEELIPLLNFPQDQPFRAGKYLHVSDLTKNLCLRKVALAEKYHMPMPSENLWPNTRITYGQGHAIADSILKDLKHSSGNILHGHWDCACKKTTYTGTYTDAMDKSCASCGTRPANYREVKVVDDEYRISGSIDVLLNIRDWMYVVEVKSKKGELWAQLEAPDPEHVIQATFYYWLLKRNNVKVHDKLSIIYVSKTQTRDTPYKEFIVQPSKMLRRLDDYLDEALEYATYKKTGKLPAKTHCANIDCTKARKCHVSTPCFDEYREALS